MSKRRSVTLTYRPDAILDGELICSISITRLRLVVEDGKIRPEHDQGHWLPDPNQSGCRVHVSGGAEPGMQELVLFQGIYLAHDTRVELIKRPEWDRWWLEMPGTGRFVDFDFCFEKEDSSGPQG